MQKILFKKISAGNSKEERGREMVGQQWEQKKNFLSWWPVKRAENFQKKFNKKKKKEIWERKC